MKYSHESKAQSPGCAKIRSQEEWRSAAKKLFGANHNILGEGQTRHQPMATCPRCQSEFVLIFEDRDKKSYGNYELSCPRCARPFRFVYLKARSKGKK